MKGPENTVQNVAGVAYIVDQRGRRLPVVDVTHPAFSVGDDPVVLEQLLQFQAARRSQGPRWMQQLLMRLVLHRSALAQGLRAGAGRYLGGLDTYLFKLGPDQLDPAWSVPIDKVIASSASGLSIRWRLRDVARLVSQGLAETTTNTVTVLSLAGGPSADVWNALLLLAKERPELLKNRHCRVVVLDRDTEGPAFGSAAFDALRLPGAPLSALDAEWQVQPWDWSGESEFSRWGEGGGAVSEGGLFDYADDVIITRQLTALARWKGASFVVGTLTRGDGLAGAMNSASNIPTVARTLEQLTDLTAHTDWAVETAVSRPLYHAFRLKRRAPFVR